MDNLAHTLAGVVLAKAGLDRKTALATATLAIGANLPDVDAAVYLFGDGVDALAFRRGWTHGVLAMAVLPFVLAAIMLAWDRLVRRRRRGQRRMAVDPAWLLAVAAIGIWSHPLLDLLNSYGVRLLMPFSGRWFYGDTLFIIDPWLWLTLAIGIVVARRRAGAPIPHSRAARSRSIARPARIAIAVLCVYVAAMAISARAGRAIVERQGSPGKAWSPPGRTMVAPVAANPFRRHVVRDLGAAYETGVLSLGLSPRYAPVGVEPTGRSSDGVAAASRTREGRKFLSWSRYPRFATTPAGDSIRVRISDARYTDARGRGWAAVEVTVPASSAVTAR